MKLLGALALLLASRSAEAVVRTRTATGTALAWRGRCPELVLDALEYPGVPRDRVHAALLRSAAAWSAPTWACTAFHLAVRDGMVSGHDVAYDGTNVVLWRLPGFCEGGSHRDDDLCQTLRAAAVTTIFFYDKPGDPNDGEILETDVEINAMAYSFADDRDPTKLDLQNTLTHELGHVLGLDHTCRVSLGGTLLTDQNGAPVPLCYPPESLSPEETQATMYAFESLGEVKKRTPQMDELHEICAIYHDHGNGCANGEGDGCELMPLSRTLPIGLFAGAAAGWIVVRRLRGHRR